MKRTTNEQYYEQELISSLSKQSTVLDAFQIKFNRYGIYCSGNLVSMSYYATELFPKLTTANIISPEIHLKLGDSFLLLINLYLNFVF